MNVTPVSTAGALVKREFWEHRALWMVPLVVAGLYLLLSLIPTFGHFESLDAGRGARVDVPGHSLVTGMQGGFTLVLYGLMSIVVFFYLSDCLYAERKDRSILFWKSLPVSDAATVLTKFVVGMLIVPFIVYGVAAVANALAFGILAVRFHGDPALGGYANFQVGPLLKLNGLLIADVLVLAAWYAPLAAYQLLVSAWAKSAVAAWTIVPPLALMLAERYTLGTWYVGRELALRISPGMSVGSLFRVPLGPADTVAKFNLLPTLASPHAWLGLVVAAALLYLTIRIRRYRDDT